jgi:hypothetical protein
MPDGHIGLRPFLVQRQRLLAEFDSLMMEGLDDAVKTTHGLGAEAVYRDWLEGFLPKRFAVTKGYIITPNEQGNSDLQEWDVLIYDQLASPVLFTRSFDGTKRRAIPVEYVRHVMEVKARVTPAAAKEVASKLEKLRPILGFDEPNTTFRMHLSRSFTCSCVFFDIGKTTKDEYKQALDNLLPVIDRQIPFSIGLILRSAKNPDWGGMLSRLFLEPGQDETFFNYTSPTSSWLDAENGQKWAIGCSMSVGPNAFQEFHFNLIRSLEGKYLSTVPSLYGRDLSGGPMPTLF